MKILMLVDQLDNWAIHNRAKAMAKYMPDIEFEIRGALKNPDCLSGQNQFDLIHFNFSYGLTDYYDFIIANQARCVITVVNERSYIQGFGVDQAKFIELINRSPWVTSVSQRIAAASICEYIPNGIDPDLFNKAKSPVVGYAGTNRENKNVQVIIDACSHLGLELRTSHYNNGSPDRPHDRMQDFYNSIDVYVHASLTEGFNNTVIEALSCNVPVLMTRQGCWQEFVGWVDFIEPNVLGVIQGLRKFCGRKLIMDEFTWPYIVPQYRKVYERACHESKSNVRNI